MISRKEFYVNGGQPKRNLLTRCSKCNEKFIRRDFYMADGYSMIKTVRTCRYCKYITAKKNAHQQHNQRTK